MARYFVINELLAFRHSRDDERGLVAPVVRCDVRYVLRVPERVGAAFTGGPVSSSAASAAAIVGYSNWKPAASSRLGSTRALFSSSDDISPSPRRSMLSGTRSQRKSGRLRAACNAAVSSALVTGFGAVRL